MNHPCDGRTDGRNFDSIHVCALTAYAVARNDDDGDDEDRPHPYSTRIFGGVPLGLDCRRCSSRSEDPKLFTRVVSFELIQHIRPRYHNVTDRRTDRRTDGRLTITVPCFALRASRGNKNVPSRSVIIAEYNDVLLLVYSHK